MTDLPADPDAPQLSQVAYDRLQAELEDLQTSKRDEIAQRLQRARELGDLSENAEYHQTKEDQALLESRIRELEHVLRVAKVVEIPASADKAVPGTIVTIRSIDDGGEPERYLLAPSNAERADDARTVTIASPLGNAINGSRPGETVTVHAPGGDFKYEVLSVEPWQA